MATDVKERISGAAYNKMRALERKAKDLRTKFGDWQVGFFEPGQPLEEYYPDQIQFVHGIIFDFGGFRTSRPIGRIPIEIQRVAMQKQREIDALHSELEEVLYKVRLVNCHPRLGLLTSTLMRQTRKLWQSLEQRSRRVRRSSSSSLTLKRNKACLHTQLIQQTLLALMV